MALLTPGTRVRQYQILSPLGAGGMGEIYLAEDTRLERKVAVKLLGEEFNRSEDRLRRFEQEARAASALNHPNILTIYEIGETDGTHFIATEYIEGETLRHYIQHSRLKLREVLDILVQVASALSAAHQAGIIHRDIKPENIMLRPDGIVKVLDFGLAKLSEKNMPATNSQAATLSKKGTDPGTIMGTVQYMSPEQARGKTVDARSDIFSFGIVLYELLAGRPPFTGESSTDVLAAILDREPLPLARFTDDLPTELQRIVTKCLRKNRDERYQTIKDVLNDLRDVKQEREFQDKLERTIQPSDGEQKTQMLKATTADESNQTTSNENHNQRITIRRSSFRKVAFGGLAILLLTAIGLGYWFYWKGNARQIESIAVMPFENKSGNADAEYLSDGMTETLISSLSNLPNLNVKPRSSVFHYKGKETNPRTIGKELNVQALLNGRVVQRGNDLSLYVELIDAALDKVIWSETYNRKQTDLVMLQTDIARDVSGKLKAKLSGADEAKVTKNYTQNSEAYQLYLKGNFYSAKSTEAGYKKAIEFYRQAIEIDPRYALAYNGIARAYLISADWYLSPAEALPKMKAEALRALEFDDQLAEAHTLLGIYTYWHERDILSSESEFKRAIELDPNNSEAHHQYGNYLVYTSRFDEGIAEMRLAQGLAPLDLTLNSDLAQDYLFAGRFDSAIEQARKTIEMDQTFWLPQLFLGLAYERKRQLPEAIAAIQNAHSLDNNPWITGYLGYVYATAGKKAEAQKIIDELKELSKQRYVPPYSIAIIYAGLNDKDQAFEWLNKSYEVYSWTHQLNVDTVFGNLRDDPRFKALLKRMKLPE
jgi:serine/threonine-protein kinase